MKNYRLYPIYKRTLVECRHWSNGSNLILEGIRRRPGSGVLRVDTDDPSSDPENFSKNEINKEWLQWDDKIENTYDGDLEGWNYEGVFDEDEFEKLCETDIRKELEKLGWEVVDNNIWVI